ncbi:MAG: addiction module protein [Xenococcus sp. (in: cyanobacteria)]
MTQTTETLKKELSQLSKQDRAEIASFLLHSLDEDIDDDVKEAWDEELTQRLTQIHEGTAKGESLEVVLSELRKKYS